MTLDDLKRLEQAATAGPWRFISRGDHIGPPDVGKDSSLLGWEWDWTRPDNIPPEPMRGAFARGADAALIAAARNALPALIECAQALDKLMAMRDECFIPNDGGWWDEKARAALARLKEVKP